MLDKFNKIKKKVNSDITNKVIKNKRTVKYKRSNNNKTNVKYIYEKIEYSLPVKIVFVILLVMMGINVLLTLLGIISSSLATMIWKNYIIPCRSFIFTISQYLVFKPGKMIISPMSIGFILFLILMMINILIEYVIPMDKSKKYKKLNFYRFLLLTVGCYLVFVLGFVYLDQNNPKIDTLYFPKQEKNKYTVDDIVKLDEDLKNKVIAYSKLMNRDKDGNIIYNGNVIDTAIEDLESASKKYDILKGKYPKKVYAFNDDNLQSDPSTLALTGPDNVGVNFDINTPELIGTVTHEFCHTRGITRENEAVLCAIIVGTESDNMISNYGAYLEAFFRTNDALSIIDSDKALAYKNEVLDLCTNNHYQEICNTYRKDTKIYVNNSDVISIGTYKLKSYDKEYINGLIDSFKDYKPELYINSSKKIKRKNLDKYFEDENAYLEIRVKNSKDDFVKVKKLLDKNYNRVRYIYQEYEGMYNGVEMSKKEAIKYYTSSIPRGNILSFFKQNELYDYSRVVRLLLEYFDSKNV